MITLAVVAGIVVYVYASGFMGPLQGVKVQEPYLEKVTLDYYNWIWISPDTGSLTLELRNTGSAQLRFADFFIAGHPVNASFPQCQSGLNVNTPACQVMMNYTLPPPLTFNQGILYNVRVVTSDGALFDFSCIAGATS